MEINYMAVPGLKPNKPPANEEKLKAVKIVLLELYPDILEEEFHRSASLEGKWKPNLNASVTLVRHLYCYLARVTFPELRYVDIGRFLNPTYNHTSVINAIKATRNRITTKELDKEQVEDLELQIKRKLRNL